MAKSLKAALKAAKVRARPVRSVKADAKQKRKKATPKPKNATKMSKDDAKQKNATPKPTSKGQASKKSKQTRLEKKLLKEVEKQLWLASPSMQAMHVVPIKTLGMTEIKV